MKKILNRGRLYQKKTIMKEKKLYRDLSNRTNDESAKLHSQTVGSRGPVLEQDSVLHESLQEFIHEKILERPVHVKGFGAFGYFQTIYSMSEYTKLNFYKILIIRYLLWFAFH